MSRSRDKPLNSSSSRNELLQVPVPHRHREGGSLSPRNNDDELSLRHSASTSRLSTDESSSNIVPEAKSPYNGLTHGVRRIMPAELACRMGCRGARCKYDRSDCWTSEQMAIKGLFSHWITDDIIAMARPRNSLIKDGNLIHRMKRAGIRSIFNLQSRNEHKDCGEGILKESGFSYDPNDFTSEQSKSILSMFGHLSDSKTKLLFHPTNKIKVYYYNYELEDYNVASTLRMLDMVKVLDFAITEGKAAIHCHAGLGRTGLFIACYLIYANRMSVNEAIHFIREKRPGSVQMNDQIQAVKDFESFIKPMRIVYSKTVPTDLDQLQYQRNLVINNLVIYSTSFNLSTFLHRQKLFLHGYERKNLKYLPKIIYVCGEQLKKLGLRWKDQGASDEVMRKVERISNELAKDLVESARKSNDIKRDYDAVNPNILIAQALATNHFPRKVLKKVKRYQHLINENNDGLNDLAYEEDPLVLSALIWSWIVELKEPILRDQELNILLKEYSNGRVQFSSNFKLDMDKIKWKSIDKGTLHTINYLIEIIHQLLPLEQSLEDKLICHLIECLTHTKLRYEHDEYEIEEDDESNKIFSDDDDNMITRRKQQQGKISIHNSDKKMQQKQFLILHKIIKELCQNPFKLTSKPLGTSQFSKSTHYDYEEDVGD